MKDNLCSITVVAPRYALDPDYVAAKVGESPIIHFTVTSTPPLPEDIRHTLTHEDGRTATKRFTLEKDKITFRDVRVADTGIYAISCRNDAGLVGKESMELEVTDAHRNTSATTNVCCYKYN